MLNLKPACLARTNLKVLRTLGCLEVKVKLLQVYSEQNHFQLVQLLAKVQVSLVDLLHLARHHLLEVAPHCMEDKALQLGKVPFLVRRPKLQVQCLVFKVRHPLEVKQHLPLRSITLT